MSVGGGVRGGYVGEACASSGQSMIATDGCGTGRGAKHPNRGEIRVMMRIDVTTYEYDARKHRSKERSVPASCMKSQGIDFSREGGKMSRAPDSCFSKSRYLELVWLYLYAVTYFPRNSLMRFAYVVE